MQRLIITADDYGYGPEYSRGIAEVAAAGAIDAVSAMVDREWCDPAPLRGTEVEIGLHLELPEDLLASPARAGDSERAHALAALAAQLERFEALFGRPPTHLDGHHHCHAAPGLASAIARVGGERGLRVRSIDPRHRRLLRCLGVETPDLLIGRYSEDEPVLPAELESPDNLPSGVVEWMVHPGYPENRVSSDYDAGREEDRRMLLSRVAARQPGGGRR
jgi:predicted glycoside hydrolase/deacetylase ChbG (UPF0249 family)